MIPKFRLEGGPLQPVEGRIGHQGAPKKAGPQPCRLETHQFYSPGEVVEGCGRWESRNKWDLTEMLELSSKIRVLRHKQKDLSRRLWFQATRTALNWPQNLVHSGPAELVIFRFLRHQTLSSLPATSCNYMESSLKMVDITTADRKIIRQDMSNQKTPNVPHESGFLKDHCQHWFEIGFKSLVATENWTSQTTSFWPSDSFVFHFRLVYPTHELTSCWLVICWAQCSTFSRMFRIL